MSNYKRYYLENRYIFITVVTYKRKPILIKNIDLLRDCFKHTMQFFEFEIFASVILPEHFHIIIKPTNSEDFSKIIGMIKRKFTQSLSDIFEYEPFLESRIKRYEKNVWQRRFYEHIIRDENDLDKHLDYIHYNPVKHNHVDNVKDWEYSSFKKFVKLNNYSIDWGGSEEIKKIELE